MAIAGLVLGVLGLIGSVIVLIFAISVVDSDAYKDFESCVDKAVTQAEQDRCAEDFGESLFK